MTTHIMFIFKANGGNAICHYAGEPTLEIYQKAVGGRIEGCPPFMMNPSAFNDIKSKMTPMLNGVITSKTAKKYCNGDALSLRMPENPWVFYVATEQRGIKTKGIILGDLVFVITKEEWLQIIFKQLKAAEPSVRERDLARLAQFLLNTMEEEQHQVNLAADAKLLKPVKPCNCCGKANAKKKCSACLSVRYCDAACQKKHWAEHKGCCGNVD